MRADDFRHLVIAIATLLASVGVASLQAADTILNELSVSPAELSLHGGRARQQLLVTGKFIGHDAREEADVTQAATFESLIPSIALVTPTGIVIPNGFGKGEIVVRYSGKEARVAVEVHGYAEPDPIEFGTEVVAALSRAGCSSGACHGSPKGKNGFRLSLRGFDPVLDFATLTREEFSRRTNPLAPDESLVLQKGLALIAHQGGARFQRTDSTYQIVRTWISQGCQPGNEERKLERLEVLPSRRRLPGSHPKQQLVARAHYTDGTVRDVTRLAVFSSSDPSAATVTGEGLVAFQKTSETTILVRYLGQIRGSNLTYVERDTKFISASPSEVNFIDKHVFAKQKDLQLLPGKLTSDAVFLRRVYLDTIATLPTAEEAARFLDSTAPQKRALLIDELLDREEFAWAWALRWADVMRGSDVTISRRGVHSFHRYLVTQFRQDKPFNDFARETLTSQGNTLYRPAANFHRIARTPQEAAEAMAQLFMGVRIGCAKCHNHPFEAITQDDYYGLAAFFSRVKFKGKQFGRDDEIVYIARSGETRHPTKNTNVVPAAFGLTSPVVDPDIDRRQILANWLTSANNPYFARSTVNRIWFHLVKQGIVDPVDDFRDTNPPSNRALLDSLANEFVTQGYRVKPIVRAILNSHTYQLSSKPTAKQSSKAADADRYFTHAAVQMLTAEQVLDAISSATGVSASFKGYPSGTRALQLAEGAVDHPFLNAFSRPVRDVTCECAREDEPSLNQVIHLLNNPKILGDITSGSSRVSRSLAEKKSDAEILELIYLSTLSRRPTSQEQELLAEFLDKAASRDEAFADLQHALLLSNEFLLRH